MIQNIEKSKKKYTFKHLIYGLILFFSFAVIGGLTSDDLHTAQTSVPEQNEIADDLDDLDAYLQGQYYIKQILKSPASAVFPYTGFIVHRLKDTNKFEVISYVDSQNSFGAMLRSSWNVVFKYQDGGTYLEKIVFDGKVVYPSQYSSGEIQEQVQETLKLIEDLQKEIQSYQ